MNDLKLLLIIILVNSATIGYAQTNEGLDSLFYLNGNIELVNITKSTSYEIECTYPGETILSVISRSELWKIKFHSGRVMLCNEPRIVSSDIPKSDSLFYRNGEVAAVTIIRSNGETLEYSFLNEDVVNTIYKVQLAKIKYANGREEKCSDLIKVKVITDKSQWKDVLITYNVNDVNGLEKAGELSKASGWGGQLAAGKGYNNAIKRLQKEAASMGCGLVLIQGAINMVNTQFGAGTRVNASAYRIPTSEKQKQSQIQVTYDEKSAFAGKSSFEQKQIAQKYCLEILGDINNGKIDSARSKFEKFEPYWNSLGIKDSVTEAYTQKIRQKLLKQS